MKLLTCLLAILALMLTLAVSVTFTSFSPAHAFQGTQVPGKPAGLSLEAEIGSLEVSADWDDVAGADEYLIRWRLPGSSQDLNEGLRTVTSDADITVSDYGEWVVRVEACNAAGCGRGVSKRVTVRQAKPQSPQNLTVSVTAGKLDLAASWGEAEGADSYLVRWRRPDGNFADGDQVTTTETSASITLSAHGAWKVRVEGCNEVGCGEGATGQIQVEAPPVNRAPAVNRQAGRYGAFVGTHNAPRGVWVSKVFGGIFSDPDGDTLTYTVSLPEDRSDLVKYVRVADNKTAHTIRCRKRLECGHSRPAGPSSDHGNIDRHRPERSVGVGERGVLDILGRAERSHLEMGGHKAWRGYCQGRVASPDLRACTNDLQGELEAFRRRV